MEIERHSQPAMASLPVVSRLSRHLDRSLEVVHIHGSELCPSGSFLMHINVNPGPEIRS